jgi:hypothetical protein
MPPLLSSRPLAVQFVLANVVPAVFGLICGIMLGVSKPVYLVLALLAILGGYFAGLEHRGGGEGAVRGLAGGVEFGAFILLVHELTGDKAKVALPHPGILLVVLTTVFGCALGFLGGLTRERRMRRDHPVATDA